MKAYKVTTDMRRFDGSLIKCEPYDLSDKGLNDLIKKLERDIGVLSAEKEFALKNRNFEEAKRIRRDIEPLRVRLRNLIVEQEFRFEELGVRDIYEYQSNVD